MRQRKCFLLSPPSSFRDAREMPSDRRRFEKSTDSGQPARNPSRLELIVRESDHHRCAKHGPLFPFFSFSRYR
ncbi:hypothetical protein CCMA1212_001997 [Trichoderma ghanense]|uniref:Uncharacterized protein n=1 Tax=Trichoderma ghanense TaxID=65468 RepID=A0ABY2HDN6_9HYPO